MKLKDLTGMKFGKLTVMKRAENDNHNQAIWVCECECGGISTVSGAKLRKGHTKSCGCLHGRGKGIIKSDESWTENLSSQKFGRLTVLSLTDERIPSGAPLFLCQCDCGNLTKIVRQSLLRGTTISCGCYAKDVRKTQHGENGTSYKHGLTRKHPIWDTYHHMKGRCYRPTDKSFHTYGGRGIAIHRPWRKSITAFVTWAMDNGYKPGLAIDRINNNGPYAPWNCQFLTNSENSMKWHEQKNRYMPQ